MTALSSKDRHSVYMSRVDCIEVLEDNDGADVLIDGATQQ